MKVIETGTYDLQFIWKYYLPLKFFNEDQNEFYY